jgi:transcriptional regulator with XRE-family HTH domain
MNIQITSCTNLRKIRKGLGLNQKDFANKLGISQPHLGNIEAGSRNVTYDVISALVEIYKISPNWLLLGIGDMHLPETIEQPAQALPTDIEKLIEKKIQEALQAQADRAGEA